MPSEAMVNIYKAFTLPHLEYCAPVLVGLSPGLSNKLELTNQFASHLLRVTFVPLLISVKSLEHRRYSQALILFYKCMYNMGPNYIKEMFLFRQNDYDLIGFWKLNQPTYHSRYMHRSYHYMTSRLWNNLPDYVRKSPSLNSFKSMLHQVNLTTGVNCSCNF